MLYHFSSPTPHTDYMLWPRALISASLVIYLTFHSLDLSNLSFLPVPLPSPSLHIPSFFDTYVLENFHFLHLFSTNWTALSTINNLTVFHPPFWSSMQWTWISTAEPTPIPHHRKFSTWLGHQYVMSIHHSFTPNTIQFSLPIVPSCRCLQKWGQWDNPAFELTYFYCVIACPRYPNIQSPLMIQK